jgi:hypothetical protein
MGAAAAAVVVVLGVLLVANCDDPTGIVTDQAPVATTAPPAPAPAADRSGQYIDVLDQIAAFDPAAVPQALVARRVALKLELDATVPGLIGCPIRVAG